MYAEDGDVLCDVLSEKHSLEVSPRNEAKSDHAQTSADSASTQLDVEPDTSRETAYFAQRLLNVSVLLCCENTLQLCSLKSLLEVPLCYHFDFEHLHISFYQ